MDSQEDSIDIAKLKRFALGLAESDSSEPPVNERYPYSSTHISDSDNTQGRPQSVRQDPGDDGHPAGQEIASRRVSESAVHGANPVPQNPPHNVNVTSPRKTSSQTEPLYSHPKPAFGKMSSGDSGPGDTQPVSQSVFDSIIKRDMFQPFQEENKADVDMGYDEGTVRMTLREGDSGHIDLLSGFGETEAGNENSDQDDDGSTSKVGESSPLPHQANFFPESQRFVTTPAAAEKQNDTPKLATTTTPSLPRNPLASDGGSSGGLMALSQVFKATQAPSSPFVNGLPSEPLSDRPSPNIPIQSRPLGTSMSSPSRAPSSGLRRGYTEPLANYVSTKESQMKREKIIEERRTRSADNLSSEDQSDSEFEREPSFVQRLNRQRRIDEETNAQFANLTAPARSSSQRPEKQPSPSRTSPSRDRRGRVHGSESVIATTVDETQGSNVHFQGGGTSEEETEQEEDFVPPTSQSRPPLSSTEEDKENYDVPPIRIPESTARAHDRLSQALDLQESHSVLHTPPADKVATSPKHADNYDHTSGFDQLPTSSQVINVRDSQTSPSQMEKRVLRAGNGPWSQRSTIMESRQSQQGSQAGLDPDVERVYSSPPAEALITSSPPEKRPGLQHDPEQENPQSSNVHVSEKHSSMPSRVADTPVHKTSGDTIFIPESSPNNLRQETSMDAPVSSQPAMQEDDDLPPPRHQLNWDDSNQFNSGDQDGKTRSLRNAKILSSPSGKQRRALTEIAADASPQVGTGNFDMDFNILSAEDREFRSVVGFSPLPPKKKRRGNDGQNIASDPAWPVTPRPEFHRPDNHVTQSEAEPVDSQSTEPTFGPSVMRRQRSKPSRRAETVWEVELSPQNPASKTAASQRPRVSRYSESRSTEARRPSKPSVVPQVVVHNQRDLIPARRGESPDPIQTDKSSQDIPAGSGPREAAPTEAQPVEAQQVGDHSEVHTPAPQEEMRAPNQVFAFWNGRKRAYYPATYLKTIGSSSQQRYVVRFVDSGPVEVPVSSVKRLELRVGDGVKVEYPNVPRVTHIVRGFSGKLRMEELSKEDGYGFRPVTDVYGHSTVILAAKQRKSLPSGGVPEPERTIAVPISCIYLDMILWNQLKDRQFTLNIPKLDQLSSRLQTPIRHHLTPVSPASRLSRSLLLTQTGLFAGMVFAVSFVEQEDAKSRVTKLITENGGRILRDGFEELFEFPSSVPSATPSKSPAAAHTTEDAKQFRLSSSAESVGFACLVADKHSRRAKYMQALALNIPCLSGRWVEDCVRQNQILDWETYLLPAGESKYLYGAVKSRILTPIPAHTARLAETIAGRPKLLDGQSVLLVMGRGKAEEKRKAYIFLTYALGASRVERVLDLKAAQAALQERRQDGQGSGWDWIYVDDHEEAAAKAMILGKSTTGGVGGAAAKLISRVGRKRKRGSMLVECIGGSDVNPLEKKIRIVGNEFVCQSLILGRLCEELT